MQSDSKGKISQVLQAICIIPLLAFGAITIFVSYRWFTRTMYDEVHQELQYVACNVDTLLEEVYPGAYELVEDDSLHLYKGDSDITYSYELLDRIKSETDLELTLFYQDTRILTTICDANNCRIVGTAAPDVVMTDVLQGGESQFYNRVLINGSSYFAYYMPETNPDGTVVGIIFVGKPCREVNAAIQKSLYPLIITTVITMAIISLLQFLYTQKLVAVLQNIRHFLADVATGNLTAELDASVSRRSDELGDIGRSALSMQRSLRTMVEQDTLTELFNRRSANRRLKQIIEKYEKQQTPFALSIGDIDFFKKVNDTYGHNCGDLVLKNVASVLKRYMHTYGFAARWGGEEFLLVFEHTDVAQAHRILAKLLEDIRSMESIYDGQVIKVTMTFGLVEGNTTNVTQLLRLADEKLYTGKVNGRNRIVWDNPEAAEQE
jgi:diguanylate cyclase (GGDEF)-like protein